VKFQFSTPGRRRFFWNVLDASGNQADYPLQNDGTSILINPSTGTAVTGTPVLYSYQKYGDYITNFLFGWQATTVNVKYQLQDRGVAYNPSAWIVAPAFGTSTSHGQRFGPVPPFKSGTKTLYAFGHASGQTDSDVMQWNL
jgi:hypothetical protein